MSLRRSTTCNRHGIKPAALLVDTIFSSDGVYADPPGFLQPAAEAIRAAGGLFIADEVQPGFGRTGEAMWGFQRHGVIPDMVSMGKPMGNGYPVAGLVLQPEVIAAFGAKARYFNTFGGNAVAAATAMAVLEVIEDEALQANAATIGAYFRDGLLDLAKRHTALGPLRAAGLFLGQDIVTDGQPDAGPAVRIVNRPARPPHPDFGHRPPRPCPENPPAAGLLQSQCRPSAGRPERRPHLSQPPDPTQPDRPSF